MLILKPGDLPAVCTEAFASMPRVKLAVRLHILSLSAFARGACFGAFLTALYLYNCALLLLVRAFFYCLKGGFMTDGRYTIEVTLSGGSGRANINSPTELEIKNGIITAEIVWSSSSYDYMEIDGKEYYPVSGEENSTFLIEVPAFDRDISVLAGTLAMSEPHLIEYTLNFNSATIKEADTFPVFAVIIGGAVLIAGVISTLIVKRRKKNETD